MPEKEKGFFARLLAKVFGRYEGALWHYGERGYIPQGIQDMRFDADASTRLEILRKSRYFEANNFVMQRLIDLFEVYVSGPKGLLVVPDTADHDWNQAASDWWAGWCQYPDLSSKQTFGTIQSLMCRAWFVDGECFVIKTYSPDTKRPRIQLIEAHRVATPAKEVGREGKSVCDGVEIDPATGRPIGYWVNMGNSASPQTMGSGGNPINQESAFRLIPADQVVHLFEPSRIGQYRGLPFIYSVINRLQDLDELMKFEMTAAKDASSITNVITTASGEVKNAAFMRRSAMQIQSQNSAGQPIIKTDPQFYNVVLGGKSIALKKGEDIKQFQSNRPSVVQTDFWNFTIGSICAGVGISRLLVMPYSMQGTVTRADLDVSASFFRARSSVLEVAVRDVYQFVMGWASQYDRRLDGAPKDWNSACVRPPKNVNVDIGRNSAAMIAELQAGLQTPQNLFADLGMDWRDGYRQLAQAADFVNKLLVEFPGVTRDQIIVPSTPPQADPEEEDEGDGKKSADTAGAAK